MSLGAILFSVRIVRVSTMTAWTRAMAFSAASSVQPASGTGKGASDDGLAGPGQVLPDLLGDEGHERVEEPQDAVERVGEHGLGRRVPFAQPDLGELDVPVAELVPDEMVDEIGRLVELVVSEARVERGRDRAQPAADPAVGERELGLPDLGTLGLEVHQDEARGVPDLVGEGLVAGHALLGQGHVHARARPGRPG